MWGVFKFKTMPLKCSFLFPLWCLILLKKVTLCALSTIEFFVSANEYYVSVHAVIKMYMNIHFPDLALLTYIEIFLYKLFLAK